MNSPYLLIPAVLLVSVLYLFCGLLVRLNLLTAVDNRKLWNSVLLVFFLTTAILGMLLAVQTNYKLEWPLVKSLLKIHVDFGIALTIVALLHFLRHIKYYLSLFKSTNEKPAAITNSKIYESPHSARLIRQASSFTANKDSDNDFKLLILLSGFLSTTVQVLFIREITTVFQGNELMMSWTLGAWMLLTGAGSFWGRSGGRRRNSGVSLNAVLFLLAVLPVLLVPVMEILKTTLFPPGIMVNPVWFLLVLLVLLAPFCLLSGFTYAMLVRCCSSGVKNFSSVYALEAVGSLTGGLAASFLFVRWLSVFQSLLVLLLLTTILFACIRKGVRYYVAVATVLAIFLLSAFYRPDYKLKSFLFVNQRILESKETYFGNVTITENAGQYNFFGNGSLLYTTDNTITREEYTHYALMQHRNPKDVLLVSGGIAGMAEEILKYNSVVNVDYVEINPQLTVMAANYLPLPSDTRLHLIFDDGRRALQHRANKYDVVILAVPDPSSMQINRFYTGEFLDILKHKLNSGAVVLYGLSSSGNYMSQEKKRIESALFHALKGNFNHVAIIPGERDYFLASDSALRIDMARLSASKGIATKYVNSYFMDDFSIQQRGKLIRENMKEKIINTDERPLPVYFHTMQFIAAFTSDGWMLMVIPLIFLLLPLFFMRSVASGMYISGFTASCFEILLIFTFQTFYGYVYSALGLIIALFMGGLALGSLAGNRVAASRNYFVTAQISLVFYALLFPLCWFLLKGTGNITGLLLIGLSTLVLSAIVGFQYVIGTKILNADSIQTAPLLYAVDLIGAALGTIVITVLLLPLAGVINSCLIIGLINLLLLLVNSKRSM